jgi:sugar diacid utilization regulator/putative methionine-R-sulfoxide reductase with GAF domain
MGERVSGTFDAVEHESHRELERTVRELEFLQRLSQSAASTMDSDALLSLLIHETTSALGTDVCSLYLLGARRDDLVLTATNGLNEAMVGRVHMRVGEGITGWVAAQRTPKLVSDVTTDPAWHWVPGFDEERFHSMLSVPIESGPRLVGVLNVQSVERREFTDEDLSFLRAIAGQVAGILERNELQRRLEAQLMRIRLSYDIHERFTKLTLEGAGIPAILDAIGALAGGVAGLYSPLGFRVRVAESESDELPARLQVPPAVLVAGARDLRATAGRRRIPVDLTPVRAGDDVLGVLAVEVPERAQDQEGRRRALEHGATVLALELSKERAAAEVERRLRGDLIEEVLAGGLDADEAERLARQAERLGHRLPSRAWVLVIEPDGQGDEDGTGSEQDVVLDRRLTELLARRVPASLTLLRSSSAVVLLPEESAADLPSAERIAESLRATLSAVVQVGSASAGIGNLATSVFELGRSHQEARQALRLARRAGTRAQVTSYRSLGAFRLLLEVQSPEALRRFVSEVLGPLVDYAQSRDTPLLETLEALVAARWVRRAAARDLGIHINSLNYRIARIEELTGTPVSDPEVRVAIAIALHARAMLGTS